MNLSYFTCVVIDLHVFPELEIQLTSLNNKYHPANHHDRKVIIRNKTYLLNQGYCYIGCTFQSSRSFDEYLYNGYNHRDDGPSYIGYEMIGTHRQDINCEYWFKYRKWHRLDGPAITRYTFMNGREFLKSESWFKDHQFHRDDGPAFIYYEIINGVAVAKIRDWYENGMLIK